MSVGELEQRGVQGQTAQTTMSHRGHPATRLRTVTSQSTGQTGGWLWAGNVFYLTGRKRAHGRPSDRAQHTFTWISVIFDLSHSPLLEHVLRDELLSGLFYQMTEKKCLFGCIEKVHIWRKQNAATAQQHWSVLDSAANLGQLAVGHYLITSSTYTLHLSYRPQ